MISVGPNGRTAAGFVTQDHIALATREAPPLSFHIIQFSREGAFLDQHVVPTSSWAGNSVIFTATGNLAVRTGERLRLFSNSMKLLAEKEFKAPKDSRFTRWEIFPTPDRGALLLNSFSDRTRNIQLLDLANLNAVKNCLLDAYDQVTSVSNRYMSWLSPSPGNDPSLNTITVSDVCGSTEYQYRWKDKASIATLVGDDSLILAGISSDVEFVGEAGRKLLWQTAFDKRHDEAMEHVETSANAQDLVVAVRTFAGGNRFLDISSHLKSIRLIVYQSVTGKQLREVQVNPGAPTFFGFSLAPDGKTLAFYADGKIEIVPLD